MLRRLRWTRPLRKAASRVGLLRDPVGPTARAIDGWLDTEGLALLRRSGVEGAAVVVQFPDGRRARRFWGVAGGTTPVGSETLFQVLSLSKPVTALCALALVDDGVLALDEPVWSRLRSWRLPEGRAGGFDPEGITLRRLLSHSAGLNVRGFGWTPAGTTTGVRVLLEAEADPERTLRLAGPPGSGLRYSGGGYALVQCLVEEVTGRPYPDVVRRRVLDPLGLRASGFEPSLGLSPRLATRHDATGGPLPRQGVACCGSSGLLATADDLATFWAVLAPGPGGSPPGRGVVSTDACAAMLAPHARDERGSVSGLGLFLKERRGDLKYMHMGFDPGWYVHAEGLARRRAVVVLLANGERGRDCVPGIAAGVRERLYEGLL